MNITVNNNYGMSITYEAENVKVVEDIEERIYSKTKDGKTDYSKPPKRDVSTEALNQFTQVLLDLISNRVADFDSSELITLLFDNLPQDKAETLLTELNVNYGND